MRNRGQEMIHKVRRRATPGGGWGKRFGILWLLLAAVAIVSWAQNERDSNNAVKFTTLINFDGTNGANPGETSAVTLVQGTDGNLYGTTSFGASSACSPPGAIGCGTVFKITPSGILTTLHRFNGTDGEGPGGALVLATDGNFYGTTVFGGANNTCFQGCGTVFKITPGGTLTTLHNFDGADGNFPSALVLATDGNFYGTTGNGGTGGVGTVFKITPEGTLNTLHNFNFNGTDGVGPSALIQANDGNFYGTTTEGGNSNACFGIGCGTVFRITPGGTLTTLLNFDLTNGGNPDGGLVQATDGNFYGTTLSGGAASSACPFGCGTVFKITPGGTLTTLHSFDQTDGSSPPAALLQATDGSLYGTTFFGGTNGVGTVFKITLSGTLTTLHSFDGTDGGNPVAALVQATNGNFYGTTCACGFGTTGGDGTVFGLSVGLRPFVETVPASGKVGEAIRILGTDLSDATHVRFNHTEAAFKVVSKSEIETTVPDGATSGFITVTRRGPRLRSNVKFGVTP